MADGHQHSRSILEQPQDAIPHAIEGAGGLPDFCWAFLLERRFVIVRPESIDRRGKLGQRRDEPAYRPDRQKGRRRDHKRDHQGNPKRQTPGVVLRHVESNQLAVAQCRNDPGPALATGPNREDSGARRHLAAEPSAQALRDRDGIGQRVRLTIEDACRDFAVLVGGKQLEAAGRRQCFKPAQHGDDARRGTRGLRRQLEFGQHHEVDRGYAGQCHEARDRQEDNDLRGDPLGRVDQQHGLQSFSTCGVKM
jgi:hypothetical protein